MKKIMTLLSFLFAFVALSDAQSTYTLSTSTYTSSTTNGANITYLFSNNCTISNTNTKGYGTGTLSGTSYIKYSAASQYTITFPSTITITNVSFTGYDNYAGKRSYFSELNGVQYTDTTQNYFTAKNLTTAILSNVIYPLTSTPITSNTLTFTPAGNQIVVNIVITYTATSTGVENVTQNSDLNKLTNVYSIDGKRIKTNVFNSLATEELKAGVYIIDNKKIVVNKNH